jgi:hypothetical protein
MYDHQTTRKEIIMSKSLSTVLTVFKVVRIIAKVVFILCIIGGAGCLLGLAALPLASGILSSQFLFEEELTLATAYLSCIVGVVACAGEAVFAFMAERYFKNVLTAGTPFTLEGAKESFRLGIASIIISVATSVLAGAVSAFILIFTPSEFLESDINMSFSLSTGLFFLFLSLIFKYGAELIPEPCAEEMDQEKQESEINTL